MCCGCGRQGELLDRLQQKVNQQVGQEVREAEIEKKKKVSGEKVSGQLNMDLDQDQDWDQDQDQ